MRVLEPVLDLFRGPRRLVAILAVLALAATLCLVLIPNVPAPRFLETWPTPESGWEPWRPLFKGIDIRRASFSVPRPMKAHAVRIDLLEPGVEPVVHAGTPPGSPTVPTIYPSDFLKDNQLQVAFSAGSFNPFPYWEGVPVHLDGLGIANGQQFSSQALNLDSLLILRNRRGVLYHHTQPVTQHREAIAGVGGMWINLLGGTNQHEPLPPEASSVAGLSNPGRYLYWLIVDGRRQRGDIGGGRWRWRLRSVEPALPPVHHRSPTSHRGPDRIQGPTLEIADVDSRLPRRSGISKGSPTLGRCGEIAGSPIPLPGLPAAQALERQFRRNSVGVAPVAARKARVKAL